MDSSHRVENSNQIDAISDLLSYSFYNYSEKNFIGKKSDNNYQFETFSVVEKKISTLMTYFKNKLKEENNTDSIYNKFSFNEIEYNMIGIYSKTCKEALMVMLGIHSTNENITILPIFDNINIVELKYILKETEVKTLIIDEERLKILSNNSEILTNSKIRNLIFIDNDEDLNTINKYKIQLENEFKINIIKFSDILNINYSIEEISKPTNLDRIIFLTYTSSLKGVLISEKSLLNTFKSLKDSSYLTYTSDDVYYSLTSLADIPEYLNTLLILHSGGSIGFSSGDITKIFEEIQILKPTILYSFPRIFIKIYEALQCIINKLDEAKRNMIEKAIKVKMEHFQQEKTLNHHIWDKLVFNKIKNSLGGRIRLILVGGGHLNCLILEFLKITLSTNIIEIYGVTEACGVITLTDEGELHNKYIGDCVNCIEYTIKKCDKVGYFSPYVNSIEATTKSYGELCIKGNSLFSGYFKHEQMNQNVDNEGYFHTGDYVVMLECFKDNCLNLKYIDRIDNFIKTKQGFLISPFQLEEYYSTSDYITHITIIPDSELNLIGIIVLNKNKIYCNNNYENSENNERKRKGSLNGNLMYRTDKRKSNFKENKSKSISQYDEIYISSRDSCTDSESTNVTNKEKYSYDSLMMNPNKNEVLKEAIMKSFKIIWANNKLKAHEMINKIHILEKSVTPSVENGLLSSKMKLKREVIKDVYLEDLKSCNNG